MTTYKTLDEITTDLELIQYLEQLRSGSLVGNVGINRSLERLATNLDVVLEALQGAKATFMEGGGTIGFAANTLTFSADLILAFPGMLGSVKTNVIDTADSPVAALTAGKVGYVILDRNTDGATVALDVAATMTAFIALLAADTARLDYQIIFVATTDGLSFFDGRRLREGFSFTAEGYVDSQYGQQSELTTVHENQKENYRTFLTGGGDISWDVSAEEFGWTSAITIEFPSSVGNNRILQATSPATIPAGSLMYVTLVRDPAGVNNVTPTIAAIGSAPDTDDILVLAMHKADGRLYLWNGQSLGDGEVIQLGGVRSGIQWMFRGLGTGTQITDFTESGTFPNRAYRVGTGELMVFRNGVKARASNAYWNGVHPAGALVGSLTLFDNYVEEMEDASGTGTRIIWLQDDAGTPGHADAAHDPEFSWPGTSDYVEAFIGLQGEGTSTIDSSQLVGTSSVSVTEIAAGTFEFEIPAPRGAGLANSSDPGVGNPYTVMNDFDLMSGFDVVWCTQGTTRAIYTGGGVLRSNGVAYRSTTTATRVSIIDSQIFPADTLAAGAWNYVYIYPAITPGDPPRGVVASASPATSWGIHPTDSTFKFLTSVFVSGGQFRAFVKHGSLVTLGFDHDITAAFGALTFTGLASFTSVDFTGVFLPDGVRQARIKFLLALDSVAAPVGTRISIRCRPPGFGTFRTYTAVRGTDANVTFEVDLLLDHNDRAEFSGDASITAISAAAVISYVEGRYTSADNMGA